MNNKSIEPKKRPRTLQLLAIDFKRAIAMYRRNGSVSALCPVSQAMKRLHLMTDPSTGDTTCREYGNGMFDVKLTPSTLKAGIYGPNRWQTVLDSGELPKFKLTWPQGKTKRKESAKTKKQN